MNILNKQEKRDIEKHGYTFIDTDVEDVRGRIVSGIVVVSHGTKELHDSGFPFIKIWGVVGKELIFLGYHDHYISSVPTNTDSYGKNIFHVFPWSSKKQWKVSEHFISCSTFQIGEFYPDETEFTILS